MNWSGRQSRLESVGYSQGYGNRALRPPPIKVDKPDKRAGTGSKPDRAERHRGQDLYLPPFGRVTSRGTGPVC